MKSRFQATIGIQSQRGIYFGTTESIKGRIIQFGCPVELETDEKVTLKIELPDGQEWVLAEATIVRTAPSKRNETTRCMARVLSLSRRIVSLRVLPLPLPRPRFCKQV